GGDGEAVGPGVGTERGREEARARRGQAAGVGDARRRAPLAGQQQDAGAGGGDPRGGEGGGHGGGVRGRAPGRQRRAEGGEGVFQRWGAFGGDRGRWALGHALAGEDEEARREHGEALLVGEQGREVGPQGLRQQRVTGAQGVVDGAHHPFSIPSF